jgi:hypothetical protein
MELKEEDAAQTSYLKLWVSDTSLYRVGIRAITPRLGAQILNFAVIAVTGL